MTKRLILLTGPPRTGKTTLLLETADRLQARGYTLGGMISREIRENNVRVGFEILDYASGRREWLAHTRQTEGPRIGKYRVNVEGLDSIGVAAILQAVKNADIVLIDEIGPMELLSEAFVNAVKEAGDSFKPVLATIHYRAQHPLIRQIKSRQDADIIEVTSANGTRLQPALLISKIINLKQRKIM